MLIRKTIEFQQSSTSIEDVSKKLRLNLNFFKTPLVLHVVNP